MKRKIKVMKRYSKLLLFTAMVMSVVGNANAKSGGDSYFSRDNHFSCDNHIELEVGMNMCYAMPKFNGMTSKVKLGVFGEGRYRFSKVPVDLGLYVSRDFTCRDWNGNRIDFCNTNVMLTADYNYRFSPYFTVFGGMGIGAVTHMDISDNNADIKMDAFGYSVAQSGPNARFAFMPRVGITAFNLLRLTAGYKVQGKLNSHAFVSLGVTFGFGHIRH